MFRYHNTHVWARAWFVYRCQVKRQNWAAVRKCERWIRLEIRFHVRMRPLSRMRCDV